MAIVNRSILASSRRSSFSRLPRSLESVIEGHEHVNSEPLPVGRRRREAPVPDLFVVEKKRGVTLETRIDGQQATPAIHRPWRLFSRRVRGGRSGTTLRGSRGRCRQRRDRERSEQETRGGPDRQPAGIDLGSEWRDRPR